MEIIAVFANILITFISDVVYLPYRPIDSDVIAVHVDIKAGVFTAQSLSYE